MSNVETGLVSTIIPAYNRSKFLSESVESVIGQIYRPIEIIIVDDGSTDDTGRVIKELSDKYPEIIRSCRLENNAGPGAAREAGRKLAKGEFIQYLDSDDILLPAKFKKQVAALNASPKCGIAYGYTKLVDSSGEGEDLPFKWTGETFEEIFPALLVDRWWCTHTPLYRRSLCDRIGAWSNLRWSQDWEYDARAGALNTKLVHCREFVSMHRHHPELRQTEKADWNTPERLRNRAEFLKELYLNAVKAGVTPDDKEMQHFSRWMFFIARGCGKAGLKREAKECFAIAKKAALKVTLDLKLYEIAVAILGWKVTSNLFGFLADARKDRICGKDTLKQSWMEK